MTISLESCRIKSHDDEQCWADVRTETGFNTYQEYLNEYCDGEPQLMRYIDSSGTRARCFNGACRLFKIDEDASLTKTLDVKLEDLSVHYTELLLAIRNPSPNALLRVLLIEPKSMEQKLPMGLINVIGLGLRITPDFFKTYLGVNHAPTEFSVELPLRASYGRVGRASVMLARNYLPNIPNCPPVILIMGHPANPDSYKGLLPSRQTDPLAFAQPLTVRPQGLVKYPWPWIFERLFRATIQTYQIKCLDFNEALLYTLLPLLEICVERLRRAWEDADNQYRARFGTASKEDESRELDIWRNAQEDREHEMEQVRFRLGRWSKYYRQCENNFIRYLSSQGIRNIKSYEAYRVVSEEGNEFYEDARNLEIQIRDWLQLRVSSLALEESKKSIQLSNLQIEESQRVKIVTILAFVYVPLNLATSIFGMNIQQLNRSGQPIWVFLITTVVAVFVTFFVWFAIEQRMGYLTWRKEMSAPRDYDSPWSGRGTDYNFVTRLAILIMLLQRGYHRWAWSSRAWLRILTNELFGAELIARENRTLSTATRPINPNYAEFRALSACDYVCKHIKPGNHVDAFPQGCCQSSVWIIPLDEEEVTPYAVHAVPK